jgi:tRNA1Val (adenine37-N6)-methyltransferase
MGNSWFQFQQFRINQDRCAMKISTDAVLLGALAEADEPKHILDIGTGTGVIALMLAQRFAEAKIVAVELDEQAALQAGENFEQSRFSEQLSINHSAIQDFSVSNKFDLIVSNPPYFTAHLKGHLKERNQALHTDTLSFEVLLSQVLVLLKESARFWLILPPFESSLFQKLAREKNLFPSRIFSVKDNPNKPIHRELVEFSFKETDLKIFNILIKNQDGSPNASYTKLVSGFLLNF